jgi:hypothetical protein
LTKQENRQKRRTTRQDDSAAKKINRLIKILEVMAMFKTVSKKIFCRHKKSEVVCWHWTHGPNGNDIRYLEIQRKCPDCGKYFFTYIKKWDECEKFISNHQEKEWSDKCKPSL